MAAMEKITYPPLIKHLSEHSGFYNQLCREYEMSHGTINQSVISSWLVTVVEPVIKEVTISYPDQLPSIFKAFFTELLKIVGNKSGVIYENEYRTAWLLCDRIPALTAMYPSRLLKAIDSAIESIRTYQPEKVLHWISLMENTLIACETIEEFLACGRIYAWLCGMAHLRVKAEAAYLNLRNELKQEIKNISHINNELEVTFQNEWPNLKKPGFIGEAGGFVGFGGPFIAPPLVARLENEFFATDKKNSCAFFADTFGKVLLSEIPVSPGKIIQNSGIQGLNNYKEIYGKEIIPFNDITSCAVINSTLVLTRVGSHYLFVYGRGQ